MAVIDIVLECTRQGLAIGQNLRILMGKFSNAGEL